MTADEELGNFYLPVSTVSHDYYGGERPGDNLFSESVVCLKAETGERVWHYQLVHHGLWDYDPAGCSPAIGCGRGWPTAQGSSPANQTGLLLCL